MAQLPEERREHFSAICLYLHSREDPETVYAYPNLENRCYCPRGPKTPNVEYQSAYCLSAAYNQCPFYLAQQEAWSRHVNHTGGFPRNILHHWGVRLGPAVRESGLAAREWLLGVARGVDSAWMSVEGISITGLLVVFFATIVLFGGGAYLIEATGNGAPNDKASSAGSILTPRGPLTATTFPSETPDTVAALNLGGTASATSTEEPTATPSATATEVATSTPSEPPTEVPSPTPLPPASVTPLPTYTLTSTKVPALVQVSTATVTPAPGESPSSDQTYPAPILLEPLDGTGLQRKALLRWSSSHELNPDEVFDILVWHESMPQPAGIGTAIEQQVVVDFRIWLYQQYSGRFFWTIRIKRVDGVYLSPESPPFSFYVNESPPPAAPPPTSKPSPPQRTKPPPPPPPPPPP
jgi:hypothetical protein